MKKRIFAALIALALLGALTVSAHEVPDLTKTGTITLIMEWNGEPQEGGTLAIFRVGDVTESDGDYGFACVPEIEAVSLGDLNDPDLAAALAEAAGKAGLDSVSAPIADGRAHFADVVPGLYVVVQTAPTEGFCALRPFLISMPKFEDGHYVTDVTAHPKTSLEPAPTEPTEPRPTQPDDPKLPQTGQLNWPVPMLAVSGLALFAAGCFLRFGRKDEGYEK